MVVASSLLTFRRKTLSHRFWLHLGQRSEAAAAADEAQQGNGRGHGRCRFRALSWISEAVLYGVSPSTQTRESDTEFVFADGGCQRPRHRSGAGQSCEEGSRQITIGPERRRGCALCTKSPRSVRYRGDGSAGRATPQICTILAKVRVKSKCGKKKKQMYSKERSMQTVFYSKY